MSKLYLLAIIGCLLHLGLTVAAENNTDSEEYYYDDATTSSTDSEGVDEYYDTHDNSTDSENTDDELTGPRCGQFWSYDPAGQQCYRHVTEKLEWSAAQENCESLSANLASILSQGEQALVESLLRQTDSRKVWIGANSLKEDKVFEWVDGSKMGFTSWNYGEPNHFEDLEKCVEIAEYQYGWNDFKCNVEKESLCKKRARGASTEPNIPPTREPCQETGIKQLVCGFESFSERALFGHNDKILRGMTPDKCKKICLNTTEFECLSFDFTTRSQTCYLSASNRETAAEDDFSVHSGSQYFEKICVEVDSCLLEPVSCTVDLQAWGVNDAKSQKNAFIKVNGDTVFEANFGDDTDMILPGIYLTILDLDSCTTSNLRNFGVREIYKLRDFLRTSVPDDGFVLWISVGQMSSDVQYYLSEYGLKVNELMSNGKFVAVTQKGYPEKTQTAVGGDCIKGNNVQATVKVEGSIVILEEATLSIVADSGNILSIE